MLFFLIHYNMVYRSCFDEIEIHIQFKCRDHIISTFNTNVCHFVSVYRRC